MKRIATLTFVLITTAALAAGCQKRDDAMTEGAPGAGPGTTTTSPGGTSATPGGGMTTTPSDSSTSPAMPPASAASQ